MKKILISMLAVLSVSCANEEDYINENPISRSENKLLSKKTVQANPENAANPYDMAGRIHNEILHAYLSCTISDSTINAVSTKIDSISYLNTDLQNLASPAAPDFQKIQQIVSSPQLQLEQILAGSPMSAVAKNSLSQFMSSVPAWQGYAYGDVHSQIIAFEAGVINNAQFTAEEKRIILTTSSIARHSLYFESERKDKDWETSVGNRVGAVQGALSNSATAVASSLLAGILSRN
jgi:hypothetical protein